MWLYQFFNIYYYLFLHVVETLLKVNNSPTGENSPNLVTLVVGLHADFQTN
jgi:hypothetical protein